MGTLEKSQIFVSKAFERSSGVHHCGAHRAMPASCTASPISQLWKWGMEGPLPLPPKELRMQAIAHWPVSAITLGAPWRALNEPASELVPFSSQTAQFQEVSPKSFPFPSKENSYAPLFLIRLQSFPPSFGSPSLSYTDIINAGLFNFLPMLCSSYY